MSRSKVLLVDDDEGFLSSMRLALSGELEVAATPSPREALEICQRESFDAVVLDVEMPVLNGFELLSRLKPVCPGARFLFLTCLADDATYLRALGHDPDDFLNKPITPARLEAAIRHRLNRPAGSEILAFGQLRLDSRNGTAQLGAFRRIDLTQKEQLILQMLLKSPIRRVPRDELERTVWNGLAVSQNTLDTHLSNLRRKIADSGICIRVDRDRHVSLSEG